MSGVVMKVLLVLAVLILVAAAVSRLRRRPNRSRQRPERQRMPLLVPIAGWTLLAAGLLLGLSSFTADDHDGVLLPMRIASVAIAVGGIAFLVMYRNFYVAPRADEVAFRTVLGREAVIAYADITDYVIKPSGMQLVLTVRASSGPLLRLNLRLYDMTPLLMAIEFRRQKGRWPLRGEALGLIGNG
ncbi:hypothetical protein [uncultured Microbacterium sp.]|uniref:hypothetical protein n=1 Tax=uncultured Microbacterium sp. TaxID=191216 RepID=UPI0025E50CD9|nr:hypothetical protein [uncultured Microbacterium sp.]